MRLKVTVELVVNVSDQRAFDRYKTNDAYATAQAMTAEAAKHAEEIKSDMASDGMTAEHVGVVVTPLHG